MSQNEKKGQGGEHTQPKKWVQQMLLVSLV